jgi:hypothetical protein
MRTISASPIKQMALAEFAHEGVSMTDVVRPVATWRKGARRYNRLLDGLFRRRLCDRLFDRQRDGRGFQSSGYAGADPARGDHLHFVVGSKYLGGTVWQRILYSRLLWPKITYFRQRHSGGCDPSRSTGHGQTPATLPLRACPAGFQDARLPLGGKLGLFGRRSGIRDSS